MIAPRRRTPRSSPLLHLFAAAFPFLILLALARAAAPTPTTRFASGPPDLMPRGPAALAVHERGAVETEHPQETPQQPQAYKQAPGPLSPAHAASPGAANCSACHDAQNKVTAAKCLACHREIAAESASAKGFHADKGEDCTVCHAEHQGPETPLVPLDVKTFDHAETGTPLVGAHRLVKDCALCHRPEISVPRKETRSYILIRSECADCHASPHPGREDKCLACHNPTTWSVERGGRER